MIINSIIAWIYYGQLGEMRKATTATQDAVKVARDTLTASQQSAVQQSADNARTAEESKVFADKSLQATIDNFRLDQRPWVGVQSINVIGAYSASDAPANVIHAAENSPVSGKFTPIEFTLTNSGKTPATIEGFSGQMELGNVRYQSGKIVFIANGSTLNMSKPIPPKVLIPGQPAKGSFSAVEQSGSMAAYPSVRITAIISYRDIWGKVQHSTKLCFFADHSSGPSGYTYCPEEGSNAEN